MGVAAIALFAALGGTGFAASTIQATSASHHLLRGPRGPRGFIGPRGPRGSVGPTGPAGPQGPAGADGSRLQAGDIRTAYGPIVIIQPGETKDAFASCAAGERLVGGGYLEPNKAAVAGQTEDVAASSPAPSAPTSGWFVRATNYNSTYAQSVQASAICVKVG
ncbi:MAG: hypothetical protein ACR2QA_03620 [Solirubrobacteraceae bacterium]